MRAFSAALYLRGATRATHVGALDDGLLDELPDRVPSVVGRRATLLLEVARVAALAADRADSAAVDRSDDVKLCAF